MISSKFLAMAGAVALAGVVVNGSGGAEPTRTQTGKIAPAQRPPATKSGSARGPLPDPILLDGSTQPAEKKSEYGMIGDFELPGDENVKDGKVGGPQNPGQQGQQNQSGQNGAGGMPMGLPQGGGAAGQQAQQQASKAGAAGEQQAGAQQQNPNAAGNQVAGAGDPNAKPEGVQVAQLGGEGSGDQQLPPGEKPPPVAIGDSAMRIQTSANSPGVVGAQQLPSQNTQQHEKGTGTGGKAPTGTQGPGRIEKGRTIPAGL
jgi:hypothetical protein